MFRHSYRSRNQFTHGRPSRNRFQRRAPRAYGSVIHESRFIKKAQAQTATAEYTVTMHFADLPVHPALKDAIKRRGYTTPTPIQDKAIMPILQGKDVIGIAETGTGKTAAFLIPIIEKILKHNSERVLVLVPTRELGQQIRDELRALVPGMRIYSTLCIGGANIRNQIAEIRRAPHIVIATPGRLKDLINRKVLHLAPFKTIVLDEVDRMVDMGFIHDITFILSQLPKERQSLFFSATISPKINTIIQSFMKHAVTISVKTQETSDNVEQNIIRVEAGAFKFDVLETVLKKEEFKKVLIFGKTKWGVEKLSKALYKKGFKVASIHGDKPQHKRHEAIRLFKEDIISVLVATDVAARGIDIPNITHVINYDQPATYEDYIHRIGRTGRAQQKGYAFTFV